MAALDVFSGRLLMRGASGGADAASLDAVPFELLMNSVLHTWELQVSEGATAAAAAAAVAGGAGTIVTGVPVAAPATLALALRAPSPELPAGARHLRCLDTTHDATCQLCTPPPLEGEEGAMAAQPYISCCAVRCAPAHRLIWCCRAAARCRAVRAGRRRREEERREGASAAPCAPPRTSPASRTAQRALHTALEPRPRR
jgi:hypothetical protein